MAGTRRQRGRHTGPRRRRGLWQRVTLVVAAFAGLSVMLYPVAATWLTASAQSATIASYAEQARSMPAAEKTGILEDAQRYNASLPPGLIHDPYSTTADASKDDAVLTARYRTQLKVAGTDVMAQVDIPSIHATLPVYHGTDPATLDLGAGHVFGSSLPVGGAGTHTVITAHAGLPQATMFTDLTKVRRGDLFTITVLGETLTYKVDRITTVKPDDTRDLTITAGKDYATLVTCTPLYVNSHRLLVRGERVPNPTDAAQQVSAPNGPGFPWWILVLVVVPTAIALLLFLPRRTPSSGRPPAR